MKKIGILLLLLILLTTVRSQNKSNVFDFSGINVFWEILDTLEKDVKPSNDLWEKLFATPV